MLLRIEGEKVKVKVKGKVEAQRQRGRGASCFGTLREHLCGVAVRLCKDEMGYADGRSGSRSAENLGHPRQAQ